MNFYYFTIKSQFGGPVLGIEGPYPSIEIAQNRAQGFLRDYTVEYYTISASAVQ